MTGSVGGTGNSTTNDPIIPNTDPAYSGQDADPRRRVGSGYPTGTSYSYSRSSGAQYSPETSNVDLDAPSSSSNNASNTASVDDEFQKRLESRLKSFQSIFSNFNAQFSEGRFDLSDTFTLLLMVRGLVKDIQLLNNAQSAATNIVQLQALGGEAGVAADIASLTQQISDKEGLLASDRSTLSQLQSELSQKEAELAAAQSADNVDTQRVAALRNEIASLRTRITQVEQDIQDGLNAIASLQSAKRGKEGIAWCCPSAWCSE